EIPIVADAYIDKSFGTGALKVTPAHDLNDFEIGQRHNLPLVNMLTESGKVSAAGGPYAGLDRFDARKKVVEDLEAQGLLEGKEKCARGAPAACAKCGSQKLEQDPDVLDTWFSSWLWPFSTMGWPEKTPLLGKFYPTSVLATGHEIIFFWVARMIMAGLEFMG